MRGTPEVFFMSWFVRGKRRLFKMLLQGTGKRRGEHRPSDLSELLAVAQPLSLPAWSAGSQPSRLQTSSPNHRGDGAGLE